MRATVNASVGHRAPRGGATVLLVDDQALLRETLSQMLESEPDIDVVGGTGDDDVAVSIAVEERPDVVIVDAAHPGAVVARLERLRGASPRSRLIVLSVYEHPALVREVLARQVSGYLTKNTSREELLAAIRSVVDNPDRVVLSLSRNGLSTLHDRSECALSRREVEVLEKVAEGMSNRQVAVRLAITEATVKRHLRSVFDKLGAVSRTEAVNKARSALLIVPAVTAPVAEPPGRRPPGIVPLGQHRAHRYLSRSSAVRGGALSPGDGNRSPLR